MTIYIDGITLDEVVKDYIEKALKHHRYHIGKTANALGVARATLYRRIQLYKIDRTSERSLL